MIMYESFEKTYPHHPFAGLVSLGIALAGMFARVSEKPAATRPPEGAAPTAR